MFHHAHWSTHLLDIGHRIEQVVAIGQLGPVQEQNVVVISLQVSIGNHVATLHLHRLNVAVQVQHCGHVRVEALMVQHLDTLIQPDNRVLLECLAVEVVDVDTVHIAWRLLQAQPQPYRGRDGELYGDI